MKRDYSELDPRVAGRGRLARGVDVLLGRFFVDLCGGEVVLVLDHAVVAGVVAVVAVGAAVRAVVLARVRVGGGVRELDLSMM